MALSKDIKQTWQCASWIWARFGRLCLVWCCDLIYDKSINHQSYLIINSDSFSFVCGKCHNNKNNSFPPCKPISAMPAKALLNTLFSRPVDIFIGIKYTNKAGNAYTIKTNAFSARMPSKHNSFLLCLLITSNCSMSNYLCLQNRRQDILIKFEIAEEY